MSLNFSTIGRILALGIMIWVGYHLGIATYVWSLHETDKLTFLIAGEYGRSLSYVIQFGQQPALILRELTRDPRIRRILAIVFWTAVLVDAGTNVGAFVSQALARDWSALHPFVASMGHVIGYIIAIAIAFGDEALIWMCGAILYVLGLVLADFGFRSPKWFNVKTAMKATQAASGASASNFPSPDQIFGDQPRSDRGGSDSGGYGGRQRATS